MPTVIDWLTTIGSFSPYISMNRRKILRASLVERKIFTTLCRQQDSGATLMHHNILKTANGFSSRAVTLSVAVKLNLLAYMKLWLVMKIWSLSCSPPSPSIGIDLHHYIVDLNNKKMFSSSYNSLSRQHCRPINPPILLLLSIYHRFHAESHFYSSRLAIAVRLNLPCSLATASRSCFEYCRMTDLFPIPLCVQDCTHMTLILERFFFLSP